MIDRYYFNNHKILNKTPYCLNGKNGYKIKKELTYKEFIEYQEYNSNSIDPSGFLYVVIEIQRITISDEVMSLEEEMKLGFIKIFYIDIFCDLTKEKIKKLELEGYDVQNIEYYGAIKVFQDIKNLISENIDFMSKLLEKYEIVDLPNIYETFSDGINNILNKKYQFCVILIKFNKLVLSFCKFRVSFNCLAINFPNWRFAFSFFLFYSVTAKCKVFWMFATSFYYDMTRKLVLEGLEIKKNTICKKMFVNRQAHKYRRLA